MEVQWQCLFCPSAVDVPFTETPPRLEVLFVSLFWIFVSFLMGAWVGFFFCLIGDFFVGFFFFEEGAIKETKAIEVFWACSLKKDFFANSFSDCMPGSSGVLQYSFLCCWQAGGLHFCCGHVLTKAVTEMNEAALGQGASGLKHGDYCSWYFPRANDQVALEENNVPRKICALQWR